MYLVTGFCLIFIFSLYVYGTTTAAFALSCSRVTSSPCQPIIAINVVAFRESVSSQSPVTRVCVLLSGRSCSVQIGSNPGVLSHRDIIIQEARFVVQLVHGRTDGRTQRTYSASTFRRFYFPHNPLLQLPIACRIHGGPCPPASRASCARSATIVRTARGESYRFLY